MFNDSSNIDDPKKNDNRLYDFNDQDLYLRAEFPVISKWLKNKCRVIDLGCGNGSLINYLQSNNDVKIEGIEIAQSGVDFCLKKGWNVRQGEIDKVETYQNYNNQEFDFAVCNVTLQMVQYPEILLKEMTRISKYQIVSFPNFAYFENRLELLFLGVMPKKMLFGYNWYNTGHIHQLSIKDFEKFCYNNNMEILKAYHLGFLRKIANVFFPNFFSKESIFLCKSK